VTDTERLSIERACERLSVDYCRLIDDGDFKAVVQLFTPDAVWHHLKGLIVGHAGITAYFDAKPPSFGRHHVSNMHIDVVDADHAEGGAYFIFYVAPAKPADGPASMTGPAVAGRYSDRFVRTPQGWRFAERRILLEFKAA
jgi:ketosteroid isomerase-like protein